MVAVGVITWVDLVLTVEAKDDVTGEGVSPHLPAPGEVEAALTDRIAAITKHDGQLGWRVVQVEEVG